LFSWLFSRTSREGEKPAVSVGLLKWLRGFHGLFSSLRRRLSRIFEAYEDAGRFFRFLVKWGARSGMPRLVNETPYEYGRRLEGRFPVLGEEIASIVAAFNLEAYREEPVSDRRMKRLKHARRTLLHIANWPARLKSRILR
jgi:hypothetical protein